MSDSPRTIEVIKPCPDSDHQDDPQGVKATFCTWLDHEGAEAITLTYEYRPRRKSFNRKSRRHVIRWLPSARRLVGPWNDLENA